jgi:hypothetical protein
MYGPFVDPNGGPVSVSPPEGHPVFPPYVDGELPVCELNQVDWASAPPPQLPEEYLKGWTDVPVFGSDPANEAETIDFLRGEDYGFPGSSVIVVLDREFFETLLEGGVAVSDGAEAIAGPDEVGGYETFDRLPNDEHAGRYARYLRAVEAASGQYVALPADEELPDDRTLEERAKGVDTDTTRQAVIAEAKLLGIKVQTHRRPYGGRQALFARHAGD